MAVKKKKYVRKRSDSSAPKKKTSKKKVAKKKVSKQKKSSDEEFNHRELEAQDFNSVTESDLYPGTLWDHTNAIPDYTKKTNANALDNLIGVLFNYDVSQLNMLAAQKKKTVLMVTTLAQFRKVIPRKNEAGEEIDPDWDMLKYLQSRFAGKPKDVIEHQGSVGQTLEVKTKSVPDFDNMSVEQIKKFKSALKIQRSLPMKEIKDDNEEDS